jgi:gluconolactonase
MKLQNILLHVSCSILIFISCSRQQREIFDKNVETKILSDEGIGTEGPCVDQNGILYYSDQANDRISNIRPDGSKLVFMSPSGVTNGMAFDQQGRLIMCQSDNSDYRGTDSAAGKRRVVRIESDSSITVLADLFKGHRLMAPNDLVVDNQGRIYFTDPYYPGPLAEKSQPTSGVYRIDGPGDFKLVVSDLEKPNGILITPDNKFIFVADRGTQKLHQYRVEQNGDLTHVKVVYAFPEDDRGVDGMAIDTQGLIFACAGQQETSGVYVIDPDKSILLDHIELPVKAFNLCFGGPDGKNLYVAAGGRIYLIRTLRPGVVLPISKS